MKLKEFIDLLENPVVIRIIREETKEQLYMGFLGILRFHIGDTDMDENDMECKVKKFKAIPEIRHRRWKEKGLMPPMLPEQSPMYSFRDLQMELYYDIYI